MASSWGSQVGQIKEFYRKKLFAVLDDCDPAGSKTIIWDDALTGPIGLICDHKQLQDKEVQRMYSLQQSSKSSLTDNTKNLIFLTSPVLENMSHIAEIIRKSEKGSRSDQDFHVLFVPSRSEPCVLRLKNEGVYGSIKTVGSCALYLYPLESDVLSMERPSSLSDWLLDDELTFTHDAASSIMDLQFIYGIIQQVYCKGECAKRVESLIQKMRREFSSHEEQITPSIECLILMDRTTDMLSPFMNQLTYEGLLDEIFTIKNTRICVAEENFPQQGTGSSNKSTADVMRKINLNNDDRIFAELRDRNFNAVGSYLSSKAKQITAKFEEKNMMKTIPEIKQFVSELPRLQADRSLLATHTTLAELIKEFTADEDFLEGLRCQQEYLNGIGTDKFSSYLEDCICRQVDFEKVLRLIVIQSYCNGGLKPTVLQSYKSALIQSYGFGVMVWLSNLEKAGLIKIQTSSIKTFTSIRDKLDLVMDGVDEKNPLDMAYVHSGYAPLSARLVQTTLKPGGWKSLSKILQLLPGEEKYEVQQLPESLRRRRNSVTSLGNLSSDRPGESGDRCVLVWFLGGVTFAEISALRFLCQEEPGLEIIIATTHIINGNTTINQLGSNLLPLAT